MSLEIDDLKKQKSESDSIELLLLEDGYEKQTNLTALIWSYLMILLKGRNVFFDREKNWKILGKNFLAVLWSFLMIFSSFNDHCFLNEFWISLLLIINVILFALGKKILHLI